MMLCRSCGKEIHPGRMCSSESDITSIIELGRQTIDMNQSLVTDFIKFDSGKNMVSLIDPEFILGVGEVLTFGATKYSKNNWQKNTDIDRYKDSTLRHIYSYLNGELLDPETKLPHLDHIATNIMFLRYFEHGKGKK